ncbi:nitroreductase family protein [Staphylococcus caeli]|uniref:nitroreductase family protein n=1 Tax=Staphylococcus caeli TaxID=2201815 RepID=UPI003F57A395
MGLFSKNASTLESLQKAIETRRTIYSLDKEISISDKEVENIIEHAIKHVPSSFNSQSTRIVLLLEEKHDKFWDITKQALKNTMGSDRDFQPTSDKIDNFKHSHGTILYYEDETVVEGLQNQMPNYAENFAIWSNQTNAMHQFAIWTALSTECIGASLQHYNPLVDVAVAEAFDIPTTWKLVAQMPFGNIREDAGEKAFHDVSERFLVRK